MASWQLYAINNPNSQWRSPYDNPLSINDCELIYTVPHHARPADEDAFETTGIYNEEDNTVNFDFDFNTHDSQTLSEDACHIELLRYGWAPTTEETDSESLCNACASALGYLAKDLKHCFDASEKKREAPGDDGKIKTADGARSVVQHQNLMFLFIAARQGCPICKTIWARNFGDQEVRDWVATVTARVRIDFCWNSTTKEDWLDPERPPGEVRLICNLVPWDVPVEPLDGKSCPTFFRFQLWPSPAFDSYFDMSGADDDDSMSVETEKSNTRSSRPLALRWLSECQENRDGKHSSCQSFLQHGGGGGDAAQWYPSRLLDLSQISDTGKVLLLETAGRANHDLGEYITLSHCWGEWGAKELPVLTEENIAERLKDGVDLDLLPSTFQEAIDVAGWFSVKYLWIDSLCIIQDSSEDWAHEAPKMCNVYENALLNISADHAVDAREGCFRDRGHPLFNSFKLHLKPLDTSYWLSIDEREYFKWINNAPSSGRAWIFQERQLARRVLHFTAHEVFWECRAAAPSFRSETFPQGSPLRRDFMGQTKLRLDDTSDSSIAANPNLMSQWMDASRSYSQRKLTYSRDKVAAMSGIARHFGSRCQNDQYLAGIWGSEMPRGLFWTVLPPYYKPPPHPQEKTTSTAAAAVTITNHSSIHSFLSQMPSIPSWSWMSYPGRIEPSALHPHYFAGTADIRTIFKHKDRNNQYGDLQDATLIVRGFIRRIVTVRDPPVDKNGENIYGNLQARVDGSRNHHLRHLYVDVDKQQLETLTKTTADIAWGDPENPSTSIFPLFTQFFDWDPGFEPAEYHCLFVGITQETDTDTDADTKSERVLRGLLLSRTGHSVLGVPVYRRMGHCLFRSRCALKMRYRISSRRRVQKQEPSPSPSQPQPSAPVEREEEEEDKGSPVVEVETPKFGVTMYQRLRRWIFRGRCAFRMLFRQGQAQQQQPQQKQSQSQSELHAAPEVVKEEEEEENKDEEVAWENLWQRVAPYWAGIETDLGLSDDARSSPRKEGPLPVDIQSHGPENLYVFDGDAADDPMFEKLTDELAIIT